MEEIDEFFYKLSLEKDYSNECIFSDLCNFVLNVLALPHSSASCERQFSKVNLIKTKSRNRLITATINGLMLSAQRVKLEENCFHFKPNNEMIANMTSAKLYPSSPSPSTSRQPTSTRENLEEEEEIIFDIDQGTK